MNSTFLRAFTFHPSHRQPKTSSFFACRRFLFSSLCEKLKSVVFRFVHRLLRGQPAVRERDAQLPLRLTVLFKQIPLETSPLTLAARLQVDWNVVELKYYKTNHEKWELNAKYLTGKERKKKDLGNKKETFANEIRYLCVE